MTRPPGRVRLLRVVAATLVTLCVSAASPPEVVRLRVPSSRVSNYFPPKATLRTLSGDQFEALVADAEAGARSGRGATDSAAPQRPVRVEHSARWEVGTLVGRSKVTLPATRLDPVVIACDPWSPALLDSEDRSGFVRVDRTGRLILIQPANQPSRVIELRWRQKAQPDSLGRAFALRLPDADVASLALDLAPDLLPLALASRDAPEPTPTGDRTRWEFLGASRWFPIQLRSNAPDHFDPTGLAANRLWLGGSTRIDLTSTPANWVADWRVESNPESPKVCLIDLDDGLELLDVSGPDVKGYRLEPATGRPGRHPRVEVALRDGGSPANRATSIVIRGHVQPPIEGNWLIPSARPANADWLGGRTEVRLDSARVATGCVERTGRRVAARPDESSSPSTWIFESDGRPGPLAELRLERPQVDASVEIAGALRVGSFAPRVEVVATWTVGRGRLLDPSLDFPRGWVVDRVAGLDGRLNEAWHVEATAEATQRLHFDGPSATGDPTGRTIALVVSATRVETSPARLAVPMPLPRVRPTTGPVRVADERWVASIDPGWEVEPTSSRGIVWFDPAPAAPPSVDEAIFEQEAAAPASGQKLAWRWVADDAEATLMRKRKQGRAAVDERLEASLVAGRLRLVWSWTIAEAARPDSLPFHLDIDPGAAPRWRLVDRAGGVILDPRLLDSAQRKAQGFPATGLAAELPLGHLRPGPLVIRGEAEIAWSGSGSIPLTRVSASVTARRSVVVRVEDATRFRVDRAEGLSPVGRGGVSEGRPAPTETESSPFQVIVGDDEEGLRVADAWVGDGTSGRLDISTIANPGASDGDAIVTEASLVSRVSPGSDSRHRLILRVAPGSARTLGLRMPEGATLDRVRRDGQPAVVSVEGASLRVNLTLPDPSRPTLTITLDYRTTRDLTRSRRIHPASLLPTLSLACLSFTWQVNAPERFVVTSESADLVVADVADRGAPNRPWSIRLTGAEPEGDAEAAIAAAMSVDLDETLAVASPVETTLGDWLVKLDAGRWPLVLDRLVLQSVGWGPKSRINVVDLDPEHPQTASAVFGSLGLSVEPVGATFLVSTEANGRGDLGRSLSPLDRSVLEQTLFDAAIAGSDRSDRYQSPARWRGEPTPRAWLASETPDRGLVASGWRSHRFVASSWPTADVALVVADSRAIAWQLGLLAAGLVSLAFFFGASKAAGRRQRRRGVLGLVIFLSVTWSTSAQFAQVEAIIAVLPYDDLAQIEAKPHRVVLLQEDHDRLVQLARPSRPELAQASMISATHHVSRPNSGSVVVESRYALEVVGPLAAWAFPVGPAFDLSATIDGQDSPLMISPDGRTASVASIPSGRRLLVFRRSAPLIDPGREGGDGSIQVPVDRSAFALVEVDRGDGSSPIELPELAGIVETKADGLVGELGPRDRLDVRWGGEAEPAKSQPEVAATIRWDAQPSCDRIIARLTVAGKTPLRSVRLALEPGVAVIGQTVPGLVGTAMGGSADRPEWVAHVDPPLGPGSSCEVTLWRAAAATGSTRTMPRLGLVGGQLAGLVGFRKPDGWSGRLTGSSSVDLLSELDFVRRWGPLTADGLSLAGASRFDAARTIVAQVAPERVQRTVRDQVGVEVVAGGLKFTVDSVLRDRLGPSWEAEATFDGPVQLTRVEATGLAFWTQVQSNQVRLIFDGSTAARERAVHLEGVVAGPGASADGQGTQAVSTIVPWPRWAGADQEPGQLIVAGVEGFKVVSGGKGLVEDAAESAQSPTPASGRTRKTYTGRRLDAGSRVEWTPPPARVKVSVRSDLRLDRNWVIWTADLVCEVSGGAVQTLYWKLPTVWALGATLSTDGVEAKVQAETRGESTFWTIPLDHPTWNRRTLTIRSTRPRAPGMGLDYPEVTPLSTPRRGKVDRYDLAVTNLSGSSLDLESSSGIMPLAISSDRSNPSLVSGGVTSRAFRVTGQPWSLRIRGDSTEPTSIVESSPGIGPFDDERRPARLDGVDLQVAVDSTKAQGQAEVRLRPGAAFLAVFLPPGTDLIGASVEGRSTVPIKPTSGGRWLIPLGDRNIRRVVFGWVQPNLGSGAISASLPRFDQPHVPTSVRVTSPVDGRDWEIRGGIWTQVSPAEAAVDRFERIGAEIIAAIEGVNLNPTAARSVAIIDQLVEMALNFRASARSLRVVDSTTSLPKIEAWLAIQERVDAVILEAGLGPLLDEAKERVGLVPPDAEPGQDVGFEAIPDVYRIRPIGQSFHFRGITAGDPAQALTLVAVPKSL